MATNNTVRYIETTRNEAGTLKSTITDLYDGMLDVAVVRKAFTPEVLLLAAKSMDRPEAAETWSRPNAVIPTEDIFILGTDTPATPTCKAPRGAALEAYLESASRHAGSARAAVGSDLDVEREVALLLQQLSGRRNIEVAATADGRRYVPYTVRLLKEGKQISVHHDYHYPLALYRDLAQQVDTTTLISFFLTLQRPDAGGALIVYGLNSDDPNQPQLPNGWWDLPAIEKTYERMRFELFPGDFVLLASGRRFHRVEPVSGDRSRITLGGFLAFDKKRERILFWS